MIRFLSITTILFFCLSLISFILYQHSSSSLKLLESTHTKLQADYVTLVKGNEELEQSCKVTSKVVVEQREYLATLEKEKESIEDQLNNYKPKSCVAKPTFKTESNNEISYIDLDAPVDPEFVRLSEGDREKN